MSPVTLPYALLLLLTEFAAGSLLWLLAIELRGTATHGYVRMAAALAAGGVLLATLQAVALPANATAGQYPLVRSFFLPLRLALLATLLLSVLSCVAVWRKRGRTASYVPIAPPRSPAS